MAKRLLGVALLVPLLMLSKPAPAAAQANFSFAVGIPGNPSFGAAINIPIPGTYYGPMPYGPAYVPAPIYAPAPVYLAPPYYYGARAYYGPRRVYGPVYRPYHARPYYYGPRVARGYRGG